MLLPSLLIPDGVPSPAADLGNYAPWKGQIKSEDGNLHSRDVTHQVQPWQIFLRDEMRSGRLPFWNPYQFSGTPYWGDGSGAPLFPLHLLFVALPLQMGLVLLPWLRIVTGGLGVWFLARQIGLKERGAMLASLVFPLSGLPMVWLLVPMANAVALAPWVLFCVERISNGKGSWRLLGLVSGLQLLAGHPETVIHTAMVSGIYLLVRGSDNLFEAWKNFILGWLLGGALSAVQTVPLLFTVFESSKWLYEGGAQAVQIPYYKIAAQVFRIVLPGMYGSPVDGNWWGLWTYTATAVYAGVLTLPLALSGMFMSFRDRRWLALSVILVFSFLAAYHVPVIKDILHSIPILAKVAHHRLFFIMGLTLALLAGYGLERWSEGRGAVWIMSGAALVMLMMAAAWYLSAGLWKSHGMYGSQVLRIAAVSAMVLLLSLTLLLKSEARFRLFYVVLIVIAADLIAVHGRLNPGLPLHELYPETPAIAFLMDKPGRVAGVGHALHPNAAMVYGLYDVRGDNVVKLERYERFYSKFSEEYDPVYFEPIADWDSPELMETGLRWVVAENGTRAPEDNWETAYRGDDAVIFELPDYRPVVRWQDTDSAENIKVLERIPGYWKIGWSTSERAVLEIAETWDNGWKAYLPGRPGDFSPEIIDGVYMGVPVGPGSGELVLKYIPSGFLKGLVVTVAGIAILLCLSFLDYRKRRRSLRD